MDKNENEEIRVLTKKIINEIENRPERSISFFESIFLGDNPNSISFDKYLEQLQKKLKKCSCQGSWTHNQLVIHCLDCQKTFGACICVKCFLKGNHQGHKIMIAHADAASCDCGDPVFWSPKGFCSDHPGPESNPEFTQLQRDTRIKTISISKAIFSKYINISQTNPTLFGTITDFLSKIVSIGDAMRRCVVIGIQGSFTIYQLLTNCYKIPNFAAEKFLNFLGSIVGDQVFRRFFSISFLNDFPKFLSYNHSNATKSNPDKSIDIVYRFTFHAATIPLISDLIKKSVFDWKTVFINSIKIIFENCLKKMSRSYNEAIYLYNSMDRIYTIIKGLFLSVKNDDNNLVKMVENFGSFIVKYEFSSPFSRVFGDKYDDPKETQDIQLFIYYYIYQLVYHFTSYRIITKEPLKLMKKFFNTFLFKSIDKSYKAEPNSVDRGFHFRSVLDKNVKLSQSFATHLLAYGCLNLKEKKNLFDFVSEVTNDQELFLKNWAVIPLRYYAALSLANFDFFVRNDDYEIRSLLSFRYSKNLKYRFFPMFSLLQSLLKATKDVDSFLMMIISTFGFFNVEKKDVSNSLDENDQRIILFILFHFILCLIFDTFCAEYNFFSIRKMCVISELMVKDLTIDEINSIWYDDQFYDNFYEDLLSFTSKIKTKDGSKFHLTDNSEWHPLLPYIKIPTIIPLIQKFIHDNPDSLINFPKLPSDSEHLLFSPVFWSLEFFILSKKCCRDYQIIQQLVFNALIITSQNQDNFYKNNKVEGDDNNDVLNVDDFSDLATKLKKLTFTQFLKKKIVFDGVQSSMIDLIGGFGKIGLTVLTRMNISSEFDNSASIKEEILKKNRERAKNLKNQIMNNFNKQQKSFQSAPKLGSEDDENDENQEESQKMECSICHLENKDDCFVYPALIYKSPLSSYINWRFRDANISSSSNKVDLSDVPESFETFNFVRICCHPIHSKCIQKKHFSCPADRCPRNSSIPIIAGLYENDSELSKSVLSQAEKFVKRAYYKDLKFAVYCLSSQIEVLEMRHRSNPDCLDDTTIQISLRNIYLCIWHVLRNESQKVLSSNNDDDGIEVFHDEDDDVITRKSIKLSSFMRYILQSLQFDEIGAEKEKLNMINFLNQIEIEKDLNTDYKTLRFLRCAAIFDHFARSCKIIDNKNDSEFIDWDEILSSNYLCNFFNVPDAFKKFIKPCENIDHASDEEMVLPMFKLIDVPKNFLDFIHQPFNAPVLDFGEEESVICLLTGKIIKIPIDELDSLDLRELIEEKFGNSFSIFLRLNAKYASQVFVLDYELGYYLKLSSFYRDQFGDTDIGMKRGSLLYLNEVSQEDIIDNFLSGLWTNRISFC